MGPDHPTTSRSSDPVFAGVFDQCSAAVRRTLRRMRIRAPDLHDVEQETWISIWHALRRSGGNPPSEPEKFSSTIAYRRGADHLEARARSPERSSSLHEPEPVDHGPTSEEQIMRYEEERQARTLVLHLLDNLPVGERSVVVLADFEPHHTMREIAEALDISEEAARSRHRRAHERMRQSLEQQTWKATPVLAGALLPAVAALSLDELLAVEAPALPLSAQEHARVWARVVSALGGKALAFGGGAVATMLTAKQAAAGALIAFALGGAADEAWRATSTPPPAALAAESAPLAASESAPPPVAPSAAPSSTVVMVPETTAAPVVAASDLGAEWRAIQEARGLLRGKHPAPEAALEALKRVHAAELRELREQLRAEAEVMRGERARTGTGRMP